MRSSPSMRSKWVSRVTNGIPYPARRQDCFHPKSRFRRSNTTVRSYSETFQTFSDPRQIFSDIGRSLLETLQKLADVGQTFAETFQNLSDSFRTIAEDFQNLADTCQNLMEAGQNPVDTGQTARQLDAKLLKVLFNSLKINPRSKK
jgi:uncharacterized phage infection (PIP) family protein YhgE